MRIEKERFFLLFFRYRRETRTRCCFSFFFFCLFCGHSDVPGVIYRPAMAEEANKTEKNEKKEKNELKMKRKPPPPAIKKKRVEIGSSKTKKRNKRKAKKKPFPRRRNKNQSNRSKWNRFSGRIPFRRLDEIRWPVKRKKKAKMNPMETLSTLLPLSCSETKTFHFLPHSIDPFCK